MHRIPGNIVRTVKSLDPMATYGGLFGKSYVWRLVSGRLELHPDIEARVLFSRTERRRYEAWRGTRQFNEF